MPKIVKVHVTYDETKRIISLQKGGDVQELRLVFLQVFSDVLSGDMAPSHVKFQRHDDKFKDCVELQTDERIDEDMKIVAFVFKLAKQTAKSCPSEDESAIKPQHCRPCQCVNSWCFLCACSESFLQNVKGHRSIFQRPHQIKKDTRYRLWSPVSRQNDGLIQLDLKATIVDGGGSFNGGIETVMEAIDKTSARTFYASLIFSDPNAEKNFAMTGNGKGKNITTTEILPGDDRLDGKNVFEPLYYWSYTMFRNKSYNTLYLGCDNNGKATLVVNSDPPDYPNPQALFVLNKYNLTG